MRLVARASWGTYYIAHLFGDRDEIVLFSRKFARDPGYLESARQRAEQAGRGLLLVTCEPERLRPDSIEQAFGPPASARTFGNWTAFVYVAPPTTAP